MFKDKQNLVRVKIRQQSNETRCLTDSEKRASPRGAKLRSPNDAALPLSHALRSPDRWAAPPDRVRRSDMPTIRLSLRRGCQITLAPTGKLVSANVQITRLTRKEAEVTQKEARPLDNLFIVKGLRLA